MCRSRLYIVGLIAAIYLGLSAAIYGQGRERQPPWGGLGSGPPSPGPETADFLGRTRVKLKDGEEQDCFLTGPRAESTLQAVLKRAGSQPRSLFSTVSIAELPLQAQKNAAALNSEALQALDRKDYSTAERLLLEVLEMMPSSPAIYNNLGITAYRKGDIVRAASWLEKAVQIARYDPRIRANLGLLRWIQNRLQGKLSASRRGSLARVLLP